MLQSKMDFVEEIVIQADLQGAAAQGGERIGWEEPGMRPVANIVRQNPQLADSVKEIMEGALAFSTMKTYQRAVTRYQNFCEIFGYDRSDITEQSILHYVSYLRQQRVTNSVLNQVKPALTLLLELYTGQSG